MAEIDATFNYDADFSSAISEIKNLSKELSVLNSSFNSLDKNARKLRDDIASTFAASVGDLGAFSTKVVDISSSMDHFGKSLDQGKLKLRDYYREASRAFQANSNANKLAMDQIRKTRSELVQLGIDPSGRNKGILVTPLKLDMSDMNNQLAVARKQFDIFNALVQGGATKLINFGKNTQWAGRQLTVGITVPMSIFASTVTKAFMDVDAELTRFQKVYGSGLVASTAQSTAAIRGQVTAMATDIAKQYGVAAKETAGLAADLAATGLEGQNLLDSIKQTTRLAVLGEVDRQTAMKATLAIQNAFKVNTKELADQINFLNAVENQTSTSLVDLTEAIPKAGPVIKALGGDVKDLSLLLVAMKEGGIGVAEGANSIKSGLASLINPTKSAIEVGKQYGINIEEIVKANKGKLMPTILAFQQSLNTLDDFSKAQVIEKIFGKYQFARMSALFDNLNASGSQTKKVLELMSASNSQLAAIANQEIKTLTESASMRFKRSMEAIKASLLPVGQTILTSVLPYLEKFSNFIDKVVEVGKNLPEPIKQFIKFGTAITAIAGPLVMIGGVLANFLGYVTKGAMGFVNLGRRMAGLPTHQFELLTDEQIAAAKATDVLTLSIDKQKTAMIGLNALMKDYVALLTAQRAETPLAFASTAITTTSVGGTPVVPKGKKTLPIIKRQSGGSAWVPGSGDGDRVPALLEPGEFVINRNAASKHAGLIEQINSGTPRFQNGGGIQRFATPPTGGGKVRPFTPSPRLNGTNTSQLPSTEVRQASYTPTTRFGTVASIKSRRDFLQSISQNRNWDLNELEEISTLLGFKVNKKATGNPLADILKKVKETKWNTLDEEKEIIDKYRLDSSQKSIQASHINTEYVNVLDPETGRSYKVKVWRGDNLTPDLGAINNGAMKFPGIKDFPHPTSREEAQALLPMLDEIAQTHIKETSRNTAAAAAEIIRLRLSESSDYFNIASSTRAEISKNQQIGLTSDTWRKQYETKRQSGGIIHAMSGKLIMPEKYAKKMATFTEAQLKAHGEAKGIAMATSELGTRVSSMGGMSSLIPGVNGIYEINGKKYVVKGHDTYDSALAEANGTGLMRNVFGLQSPHQEVVKIKHPHTGQEMFAVRSPYDEKFAKSTGKFDESNVFDQIVASVVRRDKDLQADNFWGNIVADVGQAGIMDKASQPRIKTGATNSVLEQLAINLGMVKGGARSHGAEAWNLATSHLSDSAIADRIKESARTAKQKAVTAGLGKDYEYVLKDLDDILSADLSAYVSHLRTVVPKEAKKPTEAALAKKAADKIKSAEERKAALEAGYPAWAMQTGAWVPGSGNGDRVPAMLEPGEFVVNKKAAMKHGGLLQHLNFVDAPRFAAGGLTRALGAAGGAGMTASFVMQMFMPMNEAAQNIADKLMKAALAVQVFTAAMAMSNKLGILKAFTSAGKAASATNRAVGLAGVMGKAGPGVGARLAGARMLASGLIMNPVGLAVVASVGALALAVMKYRQEIEKSKKAAQEAFSVGKETAAAYGVEIQSINDKLKENQDLTNQLGMGSKAAPSAGMISEDKMNAIKNDNKDLIDKIKNAKINVMQDQTTTSSGLTVGGTSVQKTNVSQQQSMLTAKFATLRQQGFSQADALEVVTGIAKAAGQEAQNALYGIKPQLLKITGATQTAVFKSAQDAQIESLKSMKVDGVNGSSQAFQEAFKGAIQSIQYAPPQDQLDAMNNFIKNIDSFDSSQIVQAGKALADVAKQDYGSADTFTQTLTNLASKGTADSLKKATLLDTVKRLGMDTTQIQVDFNVSDDEKKQMEDWAKDRKINIDLEIRNQQRAQTAIDDLTKKMQAQNAKFDEQLAANDAAVQKENDRYKNASKASAKFIREKQKEVDSINKGADAYVKTLEKESALEKFRSEQTNTAFSGLSALAQGDVIGFIKSKQEAEQNARQFSTDQEINSIEEKRKTAVDALQSQIDKENERQANAEEHHQKILDNLEKQRQGYIKTNAAATKGIQDQIDMYTSLQSKSGGAFDAIVGNFKYAASEANKAGAVDAAMNYLMTHPKGTIDEAIAEGNKYLNQAVDFETARENRRANGGYIRGAGGPTDDRIPAMLSNGEYVVRASAVNQYGVDLLDSINTQKYANGGVVRPASGGITNHYGTRKPYYHKNKDSRGWGIHTGTDFAPGAGSPVLAFEDGTIVSAGSDPGWGNHIKMKHSYGPKYSYYAHLSKILKSSGFVSAGTRIGLVGNTGSYSRGAHLHFETGNSLPYSGTNNPESYLGIARAVEIASRSDAVDQSAKSKNTENLSTIAKAFGTTADIYNGIKNNGLGSFLTGRRFGGSMTMNKPYIVGENGPEVVMPYGSGGKVMPRFKVAVPTEALAGIGQASGDIMNSIVGGDTVINLSVSGVNDPHLAARKVIEIINMETNRRQFGRGN